MTLLILWRFAVAAAVALILAPQIQCKEFTHEDIRDAMLSIVHMMRQSQEKFDRHEYREKALGDMLKRMLNNLTKKENVEEKNKEIEPLKGMILKLDKRLSNVEAILLRNEDLEKNSQGNTTEALESTMLSIQTLTTRIENLKVAPENNTNLSSNNESIEKRLDTIDSTIIGLKNQIDSWKKSFKDSLQSMCLKVASDMNPFEKHITNAEKLLSKYELKLNEYNGTKTPTDIVQLSGVALADEAWHSKMTEEMERQGKEITKIQKLLSDAEGVWKQLPKLSDLHAGTNQTLEAVVKATTDINEHTEASISKMTTKLSELSDRLLVTTDNERYKTLTQENTSELAYSGNISNQSPLQGEVHLQLSDDDVIANKKRIEYGLHQTLKHLSDLINLNIIRQEKAMNATIIDRLNHIEMSILSHQALIGIALNYKVQTEIAQVLLQIGTMQKHLEAMQEGIDQSHRANRPLR